MSLRRQTVFVLAPNVCYFRENITRHTPQLDRKFQGRNNKAYPVSKQTNLGKKLQDIPYTKTNNFREEITRHTPQPDRKFQG